MRRFASLFAVLITALALVTGLGAAPASAAETSTGTGWLRLAHLSPDTPGTDIRLSSFDAAEPEVVLENVTFGTVSDFQRVPVGFYTVSMVPAGSPPDTAPVLTASIQVASGDCYTIVALGRNPDLTAKVFADERVPPPPGHARVRLIQAATAAPALDVATAEGVTVAQDTAFGTAAPYTDVPAGQRTIEITSTGGGQPVTANVDLPAGSVATLLVLDDPVVGLTVRTLVDSTGMSQMPAGGADTGYGPPQPLTPWYACLALIALAGAGALLRRSPLPTR
jgi:hypothetical protein